MKSWKFGLIAIVIVIIAIAPDVRGDIGISNKAVAAALLLWLLVVFVWKSGAKPRR